MLRVAGAVIRSDAAPDDGGACLPGHGWAAGSVLLARRRAGAHAGKWELPGGKIEEGESAAECLVRELAEELGIVVAVEGHLATNVHDYGRGPLALEAWHCRWLSGRLTLLDHDMVAWVAPARLCDFDLAEADIPLARALAG